MRRMEYGDMVMADEACPSAGRCGGEGVERIISNHELMNATIKRNSPHGLAIRMECFTWMTREDGAAKGGGGENKL